MQPEHETHMGGSELTPLNHNPLAQLHQKPAADDAEQGRFCRPDSGTTCPCNATLQGFLAAGQQLNSKWPVAILAGLVLLALALVAAVVAANPGIFQTEFKAQFLLVSTIQLNNKVHAACLCWTSRLLHHC